ncbi:DUF6216 family protein [Aeromonas caviae]|uniref:DUF6216 family protein n=1 Tax=Aeromonas caviae TaxID=648 RepID=UPI002B489FD4|nr:DUF6216 family protein [Aeromonas caviae]
MVTVSSIINIESFISIITILILILCVCVYIHKRAGSSFSLINKVVSILYSGKNFNSNEINKIWEEREDVERFNATFNTRAENHQQIVDFYEWVNKLKLNFKMLTSLGRNLDMRRRKITKVRWFEIAVTGSLAPVMAFCSLFILAISFNNAALIQMKNHKDVGWFWINSNVAYSFQAPYEGETKWKIYKKSCEKGIKNTDIPEEFNKMICESFQNEERVLQINDLIESQHNLKFHALVIMLFAFYMYACTNESLRAKRARKMVYSRLIEYMMDKKTR